MQYMTAARGCIPPGTRTTGAPASAASSAIAPPDVITTDRQPRFIASRNAASVSEVFPE